MRNVYIRLYIPCYYFSGALLSARCAISHGRIREEASARVSFGPRSVGEKKEWFSRSKDRGARSAFYTPAPARICMRASDCSGERISELLRGGGFFCVGMRDFETSRFIYGVRFYFASFVLRCVVTLWICFYFTSKNVCELRFLFYRKSYHWTLDLNLY